MGNLKYVKGNIFGGVEPIIAHGCNIVGGYASGIAGQIARLYPEARVQYMRKFNTEMGWKLGDVQFVVIHDELVIANMATQPTYGSQGIHVDYDAVKSCFEVLLNYAEENKLEVAIPKIGAGLGGGHWPTIEKIIVDKLKSKEVSITCYELPDTRP